MDIDYKTHDPIAILSNDSEAEKIMNEMSERGLEVRSEWDNNQIFVVIEYDVDLTEHMDIEEKQDRLNELFDTIHYGYDECPKCDAISKVVYSPIERNHYLNTTQLCSCGGRMGREFISKDEFDAKFPSE